MKRTKTQKGITLIALIITIVILLILATVAITSITNTNIIEYANNAVNSYEVKQDEEEGILGGYKDVLDKYSDGLAGGTTKLEEGQTVKYDTNGDGTDEDWIVLTSREGLVEIVSKDVAKDKDGNVLKLTLGYDDPEIKGNILKYLDLNKDNIPDDLDGDKVIEEGGVDYNKDENITSDAEDIAIASYNNAIETINNYCKSLVKEEIRNKVRSVGASSDTSGNYSSSDFNSWFKNIKVKMADEYYKTDFEKMKDLGIATASEDYWLASRRVYEYSDFMGFGVRNNVNTHSSYERLFNVFPDEPVSIGGGTSYAVRLIITNPEI